MKALMKGETAVFFKKFQKVEESSETTMNNIEAKVISKIVGIAEHEIDAFQPFFQHIRKIKMPTDIKRFLNAQKTKVIYRNQVTEEETEVHPNIHLIKAAFYNIIINDKSVYTFQNKQKKLLPYVEEKMIKQSFGLSSKRREAEKVNLQRDESGKMVLSKLARLPPDVKRLISSRSYMLKTLVEKIYTKKQLWGKGKRANAYAAILAAQHQSGPEREDEEEETQETLQTYQKLFEEAKFFYDTQIGNLTYIPPFLKKTKEYLKGTPESMLKNILLLNIDKSNLELYWLARLMECLPLPQNWMLKFGNGFDEYFYEPLKLTFDLHPSYMYIIEQMNNFRSTFAEMDPIHQNYYTSMRNMVFYDFFERPYKVDMFGFVEKNSLGKLTKKKVIQQSQQIGTNDWMAVQAIRNSGIQDHELIIVEDFLAYWANLNYKEELYVPAISPFGEVVWSSNITKISIDFCPHEKKLKQLVREKSKALPDIIKYDLKEQYRSENKDDYEKVQEEIQKERIQFLRHYIRNDPKPLSPPYTLPELYPHEEQFFQCAFVSPFDFEMDLNLPQDEDTPLWIEKVHAKKQTGQYISMLNHRPEEYANLKQKFVLYSIEMMKKHQPNREQELMEMIQGIRGVEDLKKFIRIVNDLDAREERKKLVNIGVVEEEDPFLDSSISQITMTEPKESEDEKDEKISLSEEESSESQEKGDEDVSSEEEKQVEEQKEEEKQEEKQEEKREEEKYNGIIYVEDENIQGLTNEELNKKMKILKKEKTLKHKFSQSRIRGQIKNIHGQFSSDVKKNLLTTQFKSYHSPNKILPNKIAPMKRQNWTPIGAPDMTEDYAPYRSQASSYLNDSVQEEIERWRERELTVESSEETEIKKEDNKVDDDTRQTIQLLPIHRIKPDIKKDGILRHISQVKDVENFKKSFVKKQNMKVDFQKRKNKQPIYDEFLFHKLQLNDRNPEQRVEVHQSIKKSSSENKMSYNSCSPDKTVPSFRRICLTNMASSLIPTEPITKKGDLVVLEARKTLISKGRGLQTFLSRNY